MSARCDVIVLGGGPTGATVAGLLARRGVKVRVLEKERFPRFHIGESLLPVHLPVFERLGVEIGPDRYLYKAGAEFYDEAAGLGATYRFSDGLPGTPDHAWQVERATFDEQLLRHAEGLGAEVREGVKVVEVELGDEQVSVRTEAAEEALHTARFCVDATGQSALLGRRMRAMRPLKIFGLAAVARQFQGLRPEAVEELHAEGNVKIFFVRGGWCWAIPLRDGRLSVGRVTREKGIEDAWLEEAILGSPLLRRLLEGATPVNEVQRVGAFSFKNTAPIGARYACVGDASCFLDPIFSSGIALGMMGAMDMVDRLLPALEEGREADPELLRGHLDHMRYAYDRFATLISVFYSSALLHDLFFSVDQDPALRRGLTTMLAGDVWREDNPFQNMLFRSNRRRVEVDRLATDR